MRTPRFALLVGILAAATLVPTTTAYADTPTPGFVPGLTLNNASDTTTTGSEPSIHIDSKDNIYASAPAGVPTGGCPFWLVHPDRLTSAGKAYDYKGTIDTDHASAGGGDCDISSTPFAGPYDSVSVSSLSLANLSTNVTTDGGTTFSAAANSAGQQIFGVDRQWQGSDQALGRHYLSVHDLATDNIQVSVSIDGGYQYVQNVPALNPTTNSSALATGVLNVAGVSGHNHFGAMVVDQTSHKLFIPFLSPLQGGGGTAENAYYVAEGDPCATVACTAGSAAGPITWTTHLAFAAPSTANLSNDFPTLVMDRNGTLYAGFTGDVTSPASPSGGYNTSRIFVTHGLVAHSASTWSTPQAIDLGTGNSNIFPWLVAGTKGNVGIAWYASTLATGSCPGAGAAGNGTSVSDNCLNLWHVAYAQSSNADSSSPAWTVTDASNGVIHRGPVCNKGLSCATGTRTLLDFFDMAMDSQGRANLVYASDTRAQDTADVEYTRQCTGTSLTGNDLGQACAALGAAAVCAYNAAYTDPAGDATGALGQQTPGPNDPAYDIVSGSLSSTADSLVLSVHLNDLTNGSVGQIFEQHFKVNGKEYYVSAQRATGTSAVTYVYGDLDATTGSRNQLGTTTGTFDDTTDIVTTAFPRSAANLTDGTVITSVIATSRRDGVAVVPDVDTATDPCSYSMNAAAPDVIVPELPYPVLAPVALVLVIGGVVLYRRRRAA